MESTQTNRAPGGTARIAGWSLVIPSALTVFAMAHHPTGSHGSGGLSALVHGAMIVLVSVLFFGFVHFTLHRGIRRPVVLAGLVSYGLSLVAHVGAATINGFVVSAMAAHGPETVSHAVFLLCWEANQALARLGVFATGAAFLLWSLDLLRRAEAAGRVTGGAGLIAGIAPAAALLLGEGEMDVHTAFVVYAAHAAWTALIGVQLLRGRI